MRCFISGLLSELSVDIGQRACETRRVGRKRETTAPEDTRKPVLPVLVDDNAVPGLTAAPRFADCHVTVFNAVLSLVMVEIVRLAICQHDEQFAGGSFFCQMPAHVANGSAEAGVVARTQCADVLGNFRRRDQRGAASYQD